MLKRPEWGPGRVDTFHRPRCCSIYPSTSAPPWELNAVADFPSIWNQAPRQGMQLHWDGNNTSVEERNAARPSVPARRRPRSTGTIRRMETGCSRGAAAYPYPIERGSLAKGAAMYKEYCAGCHGKSGPNFSGERVGQGHAHRGDRHRPHRLDSYAYELAVNQNLLYAGYPTGGSLISVRPTATPTCRSTASGCARPICTTARCRRCGSCSSQAHDGRGRFIAATTSTTTQGRVRLDASRKRRAGVTSGSTRPAGQWQRGHEGKRYGTELPAEDKDALVEYLKTSELAPSGRAMP